MAVGCVDIEAQCEDTMLNIESYQNFGISFNGSYDDQQQRQKMDNEYH